ncbi:MAG: response regulator [Clostridiales bacterium]|nr:response regulator [Clostridiales bacterium]
MKARRKRRAFSVGNLCYNSNRESLRWTKVWTIGETMEKNRTWKNLRKNNMLIALTGILLVTTILVLGTIWMGQTAKKNSEEAVERVSSLYLDELAGRREQVVAGNLQGRISDMNIALEMIEEEDLSDEAHLRAYQAAMKKYFRLEKFAFVDEGGVIHTSMGKQYDIDSYSFDYRTLDSSEISIKNLNQKNKTVIIAKPVDLSCDGKKMKVCFMEISMKEMLTGVSMQSQTSDATFSNIYTNTGVALTDQVLGGLAVEDNLREALSHADYADGYSYEKICEDFDGLKRGEASFTYNGIYETLSYVPIEGTDWFLTYLVRESVISKEISSFSKGIVSRSILMSILTVLIMLAVFGFILLQNRRNTELLLEKETADAEARTRQEELDYRISVQKQLEEQSLMLNDALRTAEEANKAKTAFLSNMSHEIRTPMNAIIGLDNIALNDPETPEKIKDYLRKIGDSADHLLELINDILDMSRIESGRLVLRNEEFSFQKILEGINTMFSSQCVEREQDYQCHINGQIDEYYIGDGTKLKQVLINILGNAVKFTPKGGKIELEAEKKAEYKGQTTLQFRISDTGIGMSEDFLPHIFDVFAQEDSSSTNKYGSSGLGMPITKSIVEMMNGNIQVESEKGVGTVFTVTVTLTNSERSSGDADNFDVDPQKMCVLIVDDDSIACEHARLVLGKAGISSEIAESGAEAIEMVKLHSARMNPYNLILVDWKMPELDGIETTRRIREIAGEDSAIIILTAYQWEDVLEEALQAGVDSFLSKPLFASTVLEEYKTAMRKRGISIGIEANKADLAGRHILLAEDVEVNAEIMMMVLQARQMKADLAVNGRIAVEKFEEHEPGYYSAILMDMRMPEMDGLEATRAIRALRRPDAGSIPIIALTANAFDEDVQKSIQAGLNAHLSKPVQPEVLYETLENLIEK